MVSAVLCSWGNCPEEELCPDCELLELACPAVASSEGWACHTVLCPSVVSEEGGASSEDWDEFAAFEADTSSISIIGVEEAEDCSEDADENEELETDDSAEAEDELMLEFDEEEDSEEAELCSPEVDSAWEDEDWIRAVVELAEDVVLELETELVEKLVFSISRVADELDDENKDEDE